MKVLKGIKTRLYPNKNQEIYLNKLVGSYRFLYNKCLDYKIKEYTLNKKNISLKELGQFYHQDLTKSPEYQWITEHNTKVLKQSIIDLLDAYKRFFVNGNGFPNFKSKNSVQSVRFPHESISKRNDYQSNRISLTREIKNIKFKTSKSYKNILSDEKTTIKSATLTKSKSSKYHLIFLVETDFKKEIPTPNNDFIGLDLGIKDFIVTSDNQRFENIKSTRNNEKKLKKLHRNLSKKQKGSQNRKKSKIKLAKYQEKINNRKENYLHLISNQIVDENQVIILENLNVKGMLKNKNLSKSVQELSLNKFKELIHYKSEWYGRDFVLIDRWFPSSKLCNCCGFKNKNLTLKDRTWICPDCNSLLDRDLNASINILNEGKRLYKEKIGDLSPKIGVRYSDLKPLESDSVEHSVN